jgi:inner membrane protein involved in colicin E2 resistance
MKKKTKNNLFIILVTCSFLWLLTGVLFSVFLNIQYAPFVGFILMFLTLGAALDCYQIKQPKKNYKKEIWNNFTP